MSFRRKITRRQFIKGAAIAGGAMMMPGMKPFLRDAFAFYQSNPIPLFAGALRGVGPGGIPVAAADAGAAPVTGVTHYTIDISSFKDQIAIGNPSLGPTTLWGFNPANPLGGGVQPQKHLGGIIVGKGRAPGVANDKEVPIQITFRNKLTSPSGKHIIPNDLTILGANEGNFRTAVHFHGGLVPWISDGGPFDWFEPAVVNLGGGTTRPGVVGLSFLNNRVLNPANIATNSGAGEYYYPLNQSARFGWYHDHAFGITRINAYAGIASALLIRDGYEASLIANQGLPPTIESSVLGKTTVLELPLVFQDKIFVGTDIGLLDPTWSTVVDPDATKPGSLWYAHIYEKNRWKLGGAGKLAPPDPSVVAEFFGDTMLVNGTTFPNVPVEPRRYRLRLLNACNARFLNLQFYVADTTANGISLNLATGVPFNQPADLNPVPGGTANNVLQIGTEGGFLPNPVEIPTNLPFNPVALTGSLIVAPAERPDLVVDFSKYAGKSVILYNDAPAPFPVGDPRNDYFPGWNPKGNPVNALTPAGFGPNSRILMRFDVGTAVTLPADATLTISKATDMRAGNDQLLALPPANVNKTRQLTLNEAFDLQGRLIQLLGTLQYPGKVGAGFGRAYLDPPTETPIAGQTEIWEIYNLTADVHPMHFHLVNCQVINRQAFRMVSGVPTLVGAALPPAANETGWKETVPMYPGQVTRIVMTFNLPFIVGPDATTKVDLSGTDNGLKTTDPLYSKGGLGTPPLSPRTGGNEYVWHCHILEHEEHDMMRPLIVT